jgi:hypothetical protein
MNKIRSLIKRRDENQEKDKVIKFPIFNGITVVALTKLGYQRHEVEKLFEELENLGYGKYVRGSKGKGNCAYFEAGENCPTEYTMVFKVKLLHSNYTGCPEELKSVNNVALSQPSVINDRIEKIKAIPHIPVSMPPNLGIGYVCSYTDDYIIIDRLVNKGYNTIEEALDTVWDDIKDRVKIKPTRYMTEKDQVISK